MAKKLNQDGVPTEIPSLPQRKKTSLFGGLKFGKDAKKEPGFSGDDPTEDASSAPHGQLFPDEPPTRPATRRKSSSAAHLPDDGGEPRTVIAGGWRSASARQAVSPSEPARPSEDPVVGWLVVVDGPGTGSAVQLGNGQNSIGRGRTARTRLDFGDCQISRSTHAVVTYDPKGNRFYIQQGTGTNLTYLDDDPVLAPTPLVSGSRILLGETTLRFIAFCDESFTWADRERGQQA